MKTMCRYAFLLMLLAVGACATQGPPFATAAATLPPVPNGMARIYFYRWLEPYETLSWTPAYLNGAEVGVTEPGSVLYRDVAPGQYTLAVRSDGTYPNQFKTVSLRAGETLYARVESLKSWMPCGGSFAGGSGGATSGCWNTFVVQVMDPAVARYEMRDLQFIAG